MRRENQPAFAPFDRGNGPPSSDDFITMITIGGMLAEEAYEIDFGNQAAVRESVILAAAIAEEERFMPRPEQFGRGFTRLFTTVKDVRKYVHDRSSNVNMRLMFGRSQPETLGPDMALLLGSKVYIHTQLKKIGESPANKKTQGGYDRYLSVAHFQLAGELEVAFGNLVIADFIDRDVDTIPVEDLYTFFCEIFSRYEQRENDQELVRGSELFDQNQNYGRQMVANAIIRMGFLTATNPNVIREQFKDEKGVGRMCVETTLALCDGVAAAKQRLSGELLNPDSPSVERIAQISEKYKGKTIDGHEAAFIALLPRSLPEIIRLEQALMDNVQNHRLIADMLEFIGNYRTLTDLYGAEFQEPVIVETVDSSQEITTVIKQVTVSEQEPNENLILLPAEGDEEGQSALEEMLRTLPPPERKRAIDAMKRFNQTGGRGNRLVRRSIPGESDCDELIAGKVAVRVDEVDRANGTIVRRPTTARMIKKK